MTDNFISSLIGVAIILFLIFLILREFNAWYWKINEIIRILKRIEAQLTNRIGLTPSTDSSNMSNVHETKHRDMLPEQVKCPSCGEELDLDEEERSKRKFTCPECGKKAQL